MDARAGLIDETAADRRRFLVIHNPTAGRRKARRLAEVVESLRDKHGVSVTVAATGARGDAERIAREVDSDVFDVVVAAGGDGTINEVINGLVETPRAGALGILPLGTANVLAGELGLSDDPEDWADALALGPTRTIRLGRVNGRRFAMMAGVGFDARVVERVDPVLKRATGKGAYVVESMVQLATRHPARYRVSVGDRSWDAASVIVANGRRYGGKFVCAPDADLAAPRLDVCSFSRGGRWDVIRYMWGLAAGRLPRFRDFGVTPADRLIVEGPEGEAVQADGDVIARLPVEIALEERPFKVVGPTGGCLVS